MNMDNISFKDKSKVCAEKENTEHGIDDSNSALKFLDLDYDMVDEDGLDFDIEWGTEQIKVYVGNKSGECGIIRRDNMIDELNDTSVDDMQSEYGSDSDGLRSLSESSKENYDNSRKQPTYHVFNENTDMKDPVFKVGMLFKSVKEFRPSVRAHSIKDGRNVRFKKNEGKRIRAICEGCNWRISASTKQGENTLQVKRFDEPHTCSRVWNNRYLNSRIINEMYFSDLRRNPNIVASELVDKINEDLNVEVTLRKAIRAKQRVRIMVEGT
ncbi:hypothetical protein ACH5RR_023350 [Cinchona calisaya]|uniref:Transposase MuDR plant domain-containing protein n=1 Tax=Cinchona calisaya TaxID=153742 RepID=A0ABD2ZAG8_9GENT